MDYFTEFLRGKVYFSNDLKHVIIRGAVFENVKNDQISFIASAPADHRASYYGSAHPFPNAYIAFENTKSKGIVRLTKNNEYEIKIATPNSYYSNLGSILIPPTVYISYNNGFIERSNKITLTTSIPYRTLTYPGKRTGPEFYDSLASLPVRTQEEILRDSAFKIGQKEFWGLRPPL